MKGMLLVAIYKFFFSLELCPWRGGREVTKFYTGMLWPKVKDLSILQVLDKKGFLFIHTAVQVASSLKPLSQTLCGPLYLISGINNLFEIHALISLMIPPS